MGMGMSVVKSQAPRVRMKGVWHLDHTRQWQAASQYALHGVNFLMSKVTLVQLVITKATSSTYSTAHHLAKNTR